MPNSPSSEEMLPREKLFHFGPEALTNSELLAIIFVTGTKDENVLELTNRVIESYGSRSLTNIKSVSKVVSCLGLGKAKACQLIATFELGERFFVKKNSLIPVIQSPEDVYNEVRNMGDLKQEQLRALYLNSNQQLVREEIISIGNENMNIINPKLILKHALELSVQSVVIVHNHPSGNVQPSDEDVRFTDRLIKACEIIGVKLVDHLIIGEGEFLSMKEQGFLV